MKTALIASIFRKLLHRAPTNPPLHPLTHSYTTLHPQSHLLHQSFDSCYFLYPNIPHLIYSNVLTNKVS